MQKQSICSIFTRQSTANAHYIHIRCMKDSRKLFIDFIQRNQGSQKKSNDKTEIEKLCCGELEKQPHKMIG